MWGLGCSSGLEEGGMRCQGLHVVVSNWSFGFLYIISNLAASKQVKVDWEQEDHQIKLKTVHGTLRQFQADQLPLWSSWAMSSFGSAFFESSPTVSDSLSVVTSDRTVFTSSCMNVPMLGNRFSIRGPCVEDAQKNKQVCPFHLWTSCADSLFLGRFVLCPGGASSKDIWNILKLSDEHSGEELSSSQELLALGFSNIFGSMCSSYPAPLLYRTCNAVLVHDSLSDWYLEFAKEY